MFDENKGDLQKRSFYLWMLLLAIGSSLFAIQSHAQAVSNTQTTREIRDQTPRDRNQDLLRKFEFIPPRPQEGDFSDFLKNLHGSYGVTLMGPRLIGASNETYNIYIPDVAPIQLFHSWQLGWQANDDLQIGIKGAVLQNIASDIEGQTGIIRGTSWENYDPSIYFNLPNLIRISGWSIFTSASFSVSLTEFSQKQGRVTQLMINQDWMVNTFPSDWSYGFSLYFNPQFYTNPPPDGVLNRQTFYLSIGHRLSYRISNELYVQTATTFDLNHRSPKNAGFFEFDDGLEDTFKISVALTPNIYPAFMSISGYLQTLFWQPSAETSIIGAEFSIGF